MTPRGRIGRTGLVLRLTALAAFLVVAMRAGVGTPPARAQEIDPNAGAVSDTEFVEQPHAPIRYQSDYSRDQARSGWNQSIDYGRSWKALALTLSGSTGTSEDVLRIGSRSTNGDMSGRVDWLTTKRLILSMNGHFSMSSVADGARTSASEQRRNSLSFQSQYGVPLYKGADLTLGLSSEFQRNYDLRNGAGSIKGADGAPDTITAQRDSFYTSSRIDAVRGALTMPGLKGFTLSGTMFGNRASPTFTRYRNLSRQIAGDGAATDSLAGRPDTTVSTSTVLFDGSLVYDRLHMTKFTLHSKKSNIDQAYADLSQLRIETSTSDGQLYSFGVESNIIPKVAISTMAALNRSLREYVARPNLNALITSREIDGSVGYNTPGTLASLNLTVNRTRAERQATGNGNTISRVLGSNVQKRLTPHIWLVALGTATLYSYQYAFEDTTNTRTFSKDDRDVASAFGSFGARFGITPRCSTSVNFSVSRVHNVSIDASRSSGNLATTIYQLNGSLRMPLNRNLSIGQDYVMTATYRAYDFDDAKDDLSRNFHIDTSIADTLFPFAYVRLDHRYYFFDNGEFTPAVPGGPRLYGVAVEQDLQTLEGWVGIRPVPGITFLVKQNLSDTQNHNFIFDTVQGTDQWFLSYGVEVNRSFWNGSQITGAIRREERYQNQTSSVGSLQKESHWIGAISFQKDF